MEKHGRSFHLAPIAKGETILRTFVGTNQTLVAEFVTKLGI